MFNSTFSFSSPYKLWILGYFLSTHENLTLSYNLQGLLTRDILSATPTTTGEGTGSALLWVNSTVNFIHHEIHNCVHVKPRSQTVTHTPIYTQSHSHEGLGTRQTYTQSNGHKASHKQLPMHTYTHHVSLGPIPVVTSADKILSDADNTPPCDMQARIQECVIQAQAPLV